MYGIHKFSPHMAIRLGVNLLFSCFIIIIRSVILNVVISSVHCNLPSLVEKDTANPYVWHFLISDIGAPLEST